MEPLASRLRPKRFEDVIGQDRVVSIIERLLKSDSFVSMILYGPTGVGKTTIAMLVAEYFPLNHFKFNASTDAKATLKQIIDSSKHYGSILLIIDEIHRMNKDIQDYLLPYVEKGTVKMLGLTTENPYIAVNPAIRSRATIYRLERPTQKDIAAFLSELPSDENPKQITFSNEVIDYISFAANGELRSAINMLEILLLLGTETHHYELDESIEILGKPSISTDKFGNDYYDILSAFHKSVRGSDVNAALHYLARLVVADDLESLMRRIMAIVYEDIGLANPMMGVKVASAMDICRHIGFPEARNALAAITIEMCLSPKSNSAHIAISEAIGDVEKGKTFKVPSHLINNPTYDDKKPYLYAHDFENHVVKQDYLPKEMEGTIYYHPQTHTKLELAFEEQYQAILKQLGQKE